MGWNNANATWPHRDAAKAEFLRFWGVAPEDPRWDRAPRSFQSVDDIVNTAMPDVDARIRPMTYCVSPDRAAIVRL